MTLSWLAPEMQAALAAMTEPQRVAVVLYGEARAESVEGLVAVGCVIRNRVDAKAWFGKDYSEVVTKPKQFSCLFAAGGANNYKAVLKLAQRLASNGEITELRAREAIWVAHGVIGNYVRDVVKGSTHYHVATMAPRPSWAQPHTPKLQVGSHVFYAGIK